MGELQPAFWLTVAASSAGSTALLAIAAFLGRSQLTHWLSKDLERVKLQHQRDLEAYKVSLIAEAEHAKIASEIKKAGALLILEKRFDAVSNLYKVLTQLDTTLAGVARMKIKVLEDEEKCVDSINDFSAASNAVQPFISEEQFKTLVNFWKQISKVHEDHCQRGTTPIGEEMERATAEQLDSAKQICTSQLNEMAKL